MRGRRAPAAAAAILAVAAALSAASPDESLPPAPARYVTDRAGVLGGRAETINTQLEQFERDTSNQVVVWIDRRLPEGWDSNSFATAAMKAWGVGQKGKDNGVLVVVFVDDRKMRIEVGYGLEGPLPDAIANRISEEMRERFKQGDYAAGVEAGVAGIIAATKGEYRGTGRTVADRPRRGSDRSGCIVPALFALFFLVLPIAMRANRRRWRTYGGRGWWTGGWGGGGWSGGGSSGGGFSGGGFSGGGGSSGGGGAGGSW